MVTMSKLYCDNCDVEIKRGINYFCKSNNIEKELKLKDEIIVKDNFVKLVLCLDCARSLGDLKDFKTNW